MYVHVGLWKQDQVGERKKSHEYTCMYLSSLGFIIFSARSAPQGYPLILHSAISTARVSTNFHYTSGFDSSYQMDSPSLQMGHFSLFFFKLTHAILKNFSNINYN